jgi:RNA polymerase sigma-70 factor, ECF subfamily
MSSKADGADWSQDVARIADAGSVAARESFITAIESLHSYLLLVARRELGRDLRSKASPSDLVQETLLKAHRDLVSFRGHNELELKAWLCGIMANCILQVRRRFECQGRDMSREEGPCAVERRSDFVSPRDLRPPLEPPSREAIRRERTWMLQEALGRIPEEDRRLVAWRQSEGCTFEEMGRRLGCSQVTARRSWLRALERLRNELESLRQDSSIGGDSDAAE